MQRYGERQKLDGGHKGGSGDQAETSGFLEGAVTLSDQFSRLRSADRNFD